jgi:hypothetical protein
MNDLDRVLAEVRAEYSSAARKFTPMHGPHEGYAVIAEEVDELWDEVKAHDHNRSRMRNEALQVAAMAVRFVLDVAQEPDKEPSDV